MLCFLLDTDEFFDVDPALLLQLVEVFMSDDLFVEGGETNVEES